jgi:pyruvate dehydrogenase E1 component beta subunit
MSGGRCQVPLVMRAPVGATGRGSQLAQNTERYFVGVPGLKVIAVSNAYDAKGILKAAVRDNNPVLIFEHKLLYGSKGARLESGSVEPAVKFRTSTMSFRSTGLRYDVPART